MLEEIVELLEWLVSALGGFILGGRLVVSTIISLIVVVLPDRGVKRTFSSVRAEEIVAVPACRESATVASKDVLPALILTDLTVSWIVASLASFIQEVVVITVDLQSLLELCQLLLARTQVKGKASSDAASCTGVYAQNGSCFKARHVIVPAAAISPFCSASVTKLGVAATTAEMSVGYR